MVFCYTYYFSQVKKKTVFSCDWLIIRKPPAFFFNMLVDDIYTFSGVKTIPFGKGKYIKLQTKTQTA